LVGIFTWWLQYFPKNRAILVQKLWEEKMLSKSVLAILRLKKIQKKKFRWPLSLRGGGGKALVAWPLVDELFFFFAASLNGNVFLVNCKPFLILFHISCGVLKYAWCVFKATQVRVYNYV
jgi:hypothetical protein